jgi:phage-related minor tail protein
MADYQRLQVEVDETLLSRSVANGIIKGAQYAKSVGSFNPTINESAFRLPLGRITGDVNKFDSALVAATQRVTAFTASAGLVLGIGTAFNLLVKSTIEVDRAMKEINAIFKLSTGELVKFKHEILDISRYTGQSFKVTSEAATELSRQGLGAVETLKRLKDSLILTRLTGLDAADSVKTLTSAVNSFQKSGLTTTEVLNKLANVDASFAVSSKDLAEALTRVGSSAQDAGVDFNQLIVLFSFFL